jgi:hypothetical protein
MSLARASVGPAASPRWRLRWGSNLLSILRYLRLEIGDAALLGLTGYLLAREGLRQR